MHNPSDEEIAAAVVSVQQAGIKSSIAYRAVKLMKRPMDYGQIGRLAKALKVSRYLIGAAQRILEVFEACPEARERHEAQIIAGNVNIVAAEKSFAREAEQLKARQKNSSTASE